MQGIEGGFQRQRPVRDETTRQRRRSFRDVQQAKVGEQSQPLASGFGIFLATFLGHGLGTQRSGQGGAAESGLFDPVPAAGRPHHFRKIPSLD